MFYDASGDDIDFPSFEPYQKTQDEPEPPQNKKKKCIIIIVVIIVILILITGIFLGIFFGLKKKQNGGSIIVKYSFKKREYHKLFNKEDLNLDEDDYEVNPISKKSLLLRDLNDINNDNNYQYTEPGTYEFEIKFKKIITSMEGMFKNNPELKSADFSKLISKKIVNMNKLFSNCTNLEKVDFNNFEAKKLETMNNCFENCSNIVVLDLKSFVTPKLMSMDSAFKGCKNLVSLNIKNFIIDSKVDAKNIFEGCMTLIDYKPPMNNNNKELTEGYDQIKEKINTIELECVVNDICLECGSEIISEDFSLPSCQNCSNKFYKSNYKCQKCMDNCFQCIDDVTCEKCFDNYEFSNDNYTCIKNITNPPSTIPVIIQSDIPTDENGDEYLY